MVEEFEIENVLIMCKGDMMFVILCECVDDEWIIGGDGVFEVLQDGFGFLCLFEVNYLLGLDDIYVLLDMICQYSLWIGDIVEGVIKELNDNECYFVLISVEKINFEDFECVKYKVVFDNLMLLYLDECLKMEIDDLMVKDCLVWIIDFVVLIGKGQCLFIVVLLWMGKIVLLQNIVYSIEKNYLECYLIVLLIDECLEEVIDMQCSVKGEVVFLIFDEFVLCYVVVFEMVIEKVKCFVEYKCDVVILFDLIMCLGCVFNIMVLLFGKVLIGGVDVNVL